jgi:hypothetical protein
LLGIAMLTPTYTPCHFPTTHYQVDHEH